MRWFSPHKRVHHDAQRINRKLPLCGATVPFCRIKRLNLSYTCIYYKAKQNKVLIFQQHSIIMTRMREVTRRRQVGRREVLFLLFKKYCFLPLKYTDIFILSSVCPFSKSFDKFVSVMVSLRFIFDHKTT